MVWIGLVFGEILLLSIAAEQGPGPEQSQISPTKVVQHLLAIYCELCALNSTGTPRPGARGPHGEAGSLHLVHLSFFTPPLSLFAFAASSLLRLSLALIGLVADVKSQFLGSHSCLPVTRLRSVIVPKERVDHKESRVSFALAVYDCVIHPSIHLSIYLSICLSIYLSICLSIYPSICPSINPSIHQSMSVV